MRHTISSGRETMSSPILRCLRFLMATSGVLLLISTAPAQERKDRWPLNPCKLPGIAEELQCGKLRVFENRSTRSGRTIDLNVVVLPALDGDHKLAPLRRRHSG